MRHIKILSTRIVACNKLHSPTNISHHCTKCIRLCDLSQVLVHPCSTLRQDTIVRSNIAICVHDFELGTSIVGIPTTQTVKNILLYFVHIH
jgi:hypothetical protein